MLKLFQAGRCSRIVYLVLLVAILTFDCTKGSIEKYLLHEKEYVQDSIYASGGLKLRGMQDDFVRNGGVKDTGEAPQPFDERVKQHERALVGTGLATEVAASAVGTLWISILVALGFITLVATIWMVFARLRDIGWPAWIGFAVLAPKLVSRLFWADMPPIAFDVLQYVFVAALVVLGFVPRATGGGATQRFPVSVPVERITTGRGQFGRRTN